MKDLLEMLRAWLTITPNVATTLDSLPAIQREAAISDLVAIIQDVVDMDVGQIAVSANGSSESVLRAFGRDFIGYMYAQGDVAALHLSRLPSGGVAIERVVVDLSQSDAECED